MSYLYLAFFMGMFGSVHCALMCGPLVLALPAAGKSAWMVVFNRVIYQVGRIMTYAVLGLILGYIGNSIAMKGWQQAISLITGVFLVLMGLFNLFSRYFPGVIRRQQKIMQPVIRQMGLWLYKPGGSWMAGVLNGLLPCGMVYMALAAALNADTVLGGAWFMAFFGLGTFPMMIGIALLGSVVKGRVRFNMSRWLPAMLLIMGVWFLLRGANLDIPMLSPLIYPEGAITCD